MIELSGWFDNLEWWEPSSGEVPRWLLALSIPLALVGAGCITASFVELEVGASFWLLLPALAAGVDWLSGARSERTTAIVAYCHAVLVAGALALLAFGLDTVPSARSLALIGPCLAVASAPLLFRIWAATLVARDMIGFVGKRRELLSSALAHESEARVVRIESVNGDQIELVRLDPSDPHDAPRWVASAILFGRTPRLREGHHLLLEKPVLGELESIDGYRGGARALRLRDGGKTHFLGSEPNTWMNFDFADEVRAGVLVMLAHHAAVAAAALALAHAVS